ncbi:MAG TPA: M48 family metallopeptidase [Steroidobacteraceae bacterium]|jgi:Zn-dependent protease with chaperone function
MSFKARYYDGRTSAAREVEVVLYADGRITVTGTQELQNTSVGEVRISERIGSTPRRISFPDGTSCETDDNELLDQWLERLGRHSREHRVFQLERRWRIALLALLITVAGTWAFMRFGLPVAADYAARVLPRSVDTAIGEGGMQTMDRMFFAPSKLPAQRQAELQSMFATMVRELDAGPDLRLELRSSARMIGANAFALPSGIVVMTDELVALSRDDGEIESVLAHELGHVVHRHSLRMLLQSSASALLMFTLLGDVNSVSTLAASVPTVLVHAKFSRDFEREADDYSYAWLKRRGIPSHRFGDLLRRIEAAQGQHDDGQVLSYFSSHPQTAERARD